MIHIQKKNIQSFDRFYRGNLLNSLSGFKSVSLIGTVNHQKQSNLALFSNIVHIGADPALIGFINRPRQASPHTLQNIESTGWYTINHIHPNIIAEAHQTSAKYKAEISEFEVVGLTPEWKENILPPFVAESKVKYALQLREIIPIQLNNTFLVIGEIMEIFIEKSLVASDGFLDLSKAGTVTSLGLDAYYRTEKIVRYNYAMPDVSLMEI
ncbi:flavin reductase [soil metagenome]